MKQENKNEYLNPYVCGFLIGLLIVAFIAIMGTGVSVTEAITRIVAWGTSFIDSEKLKGNMHRCLYIALCSLLCWDLLWVALFQRK